MFDAPAIRNLSAACLLLAALGCSSGGMPSPRAAAPETPPAADGAANERRILVTLTQAAPAPLRGAGSSSRGYAGSPEYALTERTRRIVARLAREHRLLEVEGWPIRALGVYCVVFEVPAGRSVDEVVELLAGDSRVESAQPMQRFEVLSTTATIESPATAGAYDDPYVELQHGLGAMRVFDAHPWAGGRGVTLAVVDTGVDRSHPDLAASLAMVKDFVETGDRPGAAAELHGTAVAGVIASAANNGIGTVGVAPAARILALRACWEAGEDAAGTCNSFTLAKALAFVADRRPDVVNLSLAGPRDPLLERLLRAILDGGVAVVTAYQRRSGAGAFPGSIDGVLVVESDAAACASDDPPSLLRAPGQDILAARPEGAYDFVSGSSFAAAHVSGVVALLLEHAPDLDTGQLAEILRLTSRPLAGAVGATARRVDACAALDRAVPGIRCQRR